MKTSRITCLAIATVLTCGGFVQAQSSAHIDQLAVVAERQARQVLYQSYSLHRCGPDAQELTADAFQLVRLARHIHELSHVDQHFHHGHHRGPGSQIERQAHINRDVAELDRLMHHIEDVVLAMKARMPARVPAYGHHGNGNVAVAIGRHFSLNINSGHGANRYHHGSSYRSAAMLDRIELSLATLSETVHHLLDDTDVTCLRKR